MLILASALSPLALAAAAPQEPGAIDEAMFQRLHAEVVPDGQEAWETIPWRTRLAAARVEAADRGLPLFLWTMNGHPLGCT